MSELELGTWILGAFGDWIHYIIYGSVLAIILVSIKSALQKRSEKNYRSWEFNDSKKRGEENYRPWEFKD